MDGGGRGMFYVSSGEIRDADGHGAVPARQRTSGGGDAPR